MSTTPPDPQSPAMMPDPMADPPPDQAGMRLRKQVRRVTGVLLLVALLVVIARGIYVVWQITHQSPPL